MNNLTNDLRAIDKTKKKKNDFLNELRDYNRIGVKVKLPKIAKDIVKRYTDNAIDKISTKLPFLKNINLDEITKNMDKLNNLLDDFLVSMEKVGKMPEAIEQKLIYLYGKPLPMCWSYPWEALIEKMQIKGKYYNNFMSEITNLCSKHSEIIAKIINDWFDLGSFLSSNEFKDRCTASVDINDCDRIKVYHGTSFVGYKSIISDGFIKYSNYDDAIKETKNSFWQNLYKSNNKKTFVTDDFDYALGYALSKSGDITVNKPYGVIIELQLEHENLTVFTGDRGGFEITVNDSIPTDKITNVYFVIFDENYDLHIIEKDTGKEITV